ncbi:MAG: hypothetical protein BWY29_00818 [Microgenomates group bacterium ADurb.Bin238]|nr:MAG: hypothetical protein BWY29_00818 [Microgenomates group bacterium ADurb.Bin238]
MSCFTAFNIGEVVEAVVLGNDINKGLEEVFDHILIGFVLFPVY